MRRCFLQIAIVVFVFSISAHFVYAVSLDEEAVSYRNNGYLAQERGDIDAAISWYQKAISMDPNYATPHNDLGILFEVKGWPDRAEVEYQKTLAIDPKYANAHTNLALLYERKGELEKAAFHWMKRYRLGKPNDPWAEEARQRLDKLKLLDASGRESERLGSESVPSKIEKYSEKFYGGPTAGTQDLEPEPKDETGWTKIGSKKDAKTKVASSSESKGRWTKIDRSLGKEAESTQARVSPTSKPQDKWTRINLGPSKETERRVAKRTSTGRSLSSGSEKNMDEVLQESLKLAERRLKREQNKEEFIEKKPDKTSRVSRPSSGASSYYSKADNYFKKGEYSKALDTIRVAKRDHPGETSLLELEQSVKNKMKEERITDHYNEGIMHYHQKDYSGARKEFEAILNILPE